MDSKTRLIAEQWEQRLGAPELPQSALSFASSLELDEAERFPQASIDALHEIGAFEMLIPAQDGGQLQQPELLMTLGRLISRRDLTSAIAFGQTMLGSIPVWLAGSAEQKAALCGQLRAGGLGCLALTEKEHGSDILSNEFGGSPDGEGWRLSGRKWLINNGTLGASATVLGRLRRPGRPDEMALWWVQKPEALRAQWHAHPKIRTLGIRGADISGFELRDYPVGAAALLRNGEPGIYAVLKTLQISRILCSGFSLGAADSMFRLSYRFAAERQLYGKRVLDIPAVRHRLAGCVARMMVADLVAQVASRAIAALPQELSLLSAIAKYHVPTEVEAIADELGLVLGARHYVRSEMPWGMFQKMQRDCQVVSLFDGSTQVNLSLIAAQLRALVASLSELAGRAPDQWPAEALAPLFQPEASSQGWPKAGDLQLANKGVDSIAAALLQLPAQPGAVGAAIAGLQGLWREWLSEARAAVEQRLAHDSLALMALAQRYVGLHSAACAVLGWKLGLSSNASGNSAGNSTAPSGFGDALLLAYLQQRWPGLAGEAPNAAGEDADRASALLDFAARCVDQHRLISLQPLRLAQA